MQHDYRREVRRQHRQQDIKLWAGRALHFFSYVAVTGAAVYVALSI